MNITVEDVAACRKRLKIEVPADRVNAAMREVAQDFQKQARIPGFRPGKAPLAVIEKKYRKEIEDEVQRKLIPDSYREAIASRNLQVVSSPQMEDLKFQPGLSLSYSALVELAPEFPLPAYRGMPIPKAPVEVTDEEIQSVLEGILAQRAQFEDADPPRPAALEDFVILGYTAECEGKPLKEWVPQAPNLGENPNFWLWLKEDAFLPGFVPQVVGMNVGDRKDITVTFAPDFEPAAVAGKAATFHVEVKEIKVRKLPALDDALAKELGADSADALKNQVRSTLETQKKNDARGRQINEIARQLIASVNTDLPESVLSAETDQALFEIVAENQARGVPANLLEEKRDEIYENAARSAKDQVKLNFVVQRIAEKENISITREELASRLALHAQQRDMPVDKFIRRVRENGSIEIIHRRMLLQKVLDFIWQNAKVE